MEKKPIEELKEFVEALGILAKEIDDIVEDGKINLKDLPHVFDLLRKYPALKDGIQGAKNIKDLKFSDLEGDEVEAVIEKLIEIVKLFAN